MDAIRARLDLLCVALQEIARSLPRQQAAESAAAIRHRIDILAAGGLSLEADEALAADLMPLLRALGAIVDGAPSARRLHLVQPSPKRDAESRE